jgi:hypothetical protein
MMRKTLIFIILVGALSAIISCTTSVQTTVTSQSSLDSTNPITTSEIILTVSISAKYNIEFVADWSTTTHPDNYPGGAHFSPFVTYSHNGEVEAQIYQTGQEASSGVEDMAETGSTGILNQEINMLINSNLAFQKTQGNLFNSPGTDSAELEFTQDYSYLTFVSMIAPSPDWFVSVTTNLFNGNDWIDAVELELITYDAGSDSGETFTSQNIDTQPKESITIFSDNLQQVGKLVITQIE